MPSDRENAEDIRVVSPLDPRPDLTPEQWKALPPQEKRRLRQLKLAHRRLANAPKPTEDEIIKLNQPPKATENTPFRDSHGRALHLENLYHGSSCFLVLSGPSSLTNDLSLLRRRGIYTLAVNNAATIIRPNAWVFVDPPEKFHSSIWLDPAVTKFVHQRFLEYSLREKVGEY
jgi:hypothetical protein